MHDYVIVGGGTAGCVLAHRLSEDPDVRVLQLEAGGRERRRAQHRTVPQPALLERQLWWGQETGLGHTSAGEVFHASAASYRRWATEGGWNYETAVSPYLQRFETSSDDPCSLASLSKPHPLAQAFVRSAMATGMPFEAQLTEIPPRGVGLHAFAQQQGRPCSMAAAALQRAHLRPNLTVITGANVHRIDLHNGRATGVTYIEDGLEWSADAERAVILCAGAVGSPHLLMRSGIGPLAHLHARGLEVKHPLPGVGARLQCPLAVDVCLTVDWPPASCPGVSEASAFIRTAPQRETPDVQLRFESGSSAPSHDRTPATVRCLLLQPRSQGFLRLRPDHKGRGLSGRRPYAAWPVLDPQGLSDLGNVDLEALHAGIRQARRFLRQPAFLRYHPVEQHPGPDRMTNDALRAYIRLHAEAVDAPSGTCRMGFDDYAVVDNHLRVHGLDGLYVADASVMPASVRGATALPVALLAERAATLLGQTTTPRPPVPPVGERH